MWIAALATVLLHPVPARGQARVPEVTFDYSALFDAPCFTATAQQPDSAAIRVALAHLPLWRAAWNRDAPTLLRAVVAMTHVPFKFADAKAAVVTCKAFPSMSFPLIISAPHVWAVMDTSVRGDAKSIEAAESRQFVSELFHEVLHRYVSERVEALPDHTTPLLRKYAAEPRAVRVHLHVFALMADAFRRVGSTAQAEAVLRPAAPTSEITGMRGANDINRARAIVVAEGPATFVRELEQRP